MLQNSTACQVGCGAVTPIKRSFWFRNLPNFITISRMIVGPILAWIMFWTTLNLFGAIILLLSMICMSYSDKIDGIIARRCNLVSKFGELLDKIADKIALVPIISNLCWNYYLACWETLAVIPLAISLFRIILRDVVLMVGSLLLGRKIRVASNNDGKNKTGWQCTTVCIFTLFHFCHPFGWKITDTVPLLIMYLAVSGTLEYSKRSFRSYWKEGLALWRTKKLNQAA